MTGLLRLDRMAVEATREEDGMGPDEDDMMPGDLWVWSGSDLATLEADLDGDSF